MAESATVTLNVWGEYACFTRPELKVERVSYPVITPSAARGLLEAVFWKPEMRYEIRSIDVVRLGTRLTILRNEVGRIESGAPFLVEDARQQRTSVILRDVAYVISADIVLRAHASEPVQKYVEQLQRRIERGQCHHTPCLGTREFAAHFGLPDGQEPAPLDLDVGPMLFDLAFVEDSTRPELTFRRHGADGARPAKGYARTLFFDARVEQGRLQVPPAKYQELYRLEAGDV